MPSGSTRRTKSSTSRKTTRSCARPVATSKVLRDEAAQPHWFFSSSKYSRYRRDRDTAGRNSQAPRRAMWRERIFVESTPAPTSTKDNVCWLTSHSKISPSRLHPPPQYDHARCLLHPRAVIGSPWLPALPVFATPLRGQTLIMRLTLASIAA